MKLVRVRPCVLCGNKEISEYMVNETYSFMSCDKCNISAPCGSSALVSARLWNELMKSYRKEIKTA